MNRAQLLHASERRIVYKALQSARTAHMVINAVFIGGFILLVLFAAGCAVHERIHNDAEAVRQTVEIGE